MDLRRWEMVKEAFDRVADATAEERASELERIADPEVLAEVIRLVNLHQNNPGRLDKLCPDPEMIRGAAGLHSLIPGQLAADRFRVVRFIAAGGMGEVYEAIDTHLDERVALKVIRAESAEREVAIARFKKELQLARRVSHPNVCRVHDTRRLTTPGGRAVDFFTMEFLEGETLASRIARQNKIDPGEALEIARQLVAGLGAAHGAGVVHRDLKPSNVMLVPETEGGSRVVITDFGLSRAAAPSAKSTMDGSGAGTPAYMAPEQIEGLDSGAPADIYALGVVMYEMLTGRLPFDAASAMALAVRKVRDTASPPSSVVPGVGGVWDTVVLRCLAHSPADRFANVEQVWRALNGERIPGARRSWFTGRTIAALAAGATAVVAGVFGWSAWSGSSANPEALRRYNEGLSAYRDGAVLRANSLFELAARLDPEFAPARAKLAETWMDLDYSDRANRDIVVASELARTRRMSRADGAQVAAARAAVLRENTKAIEIYREIAERSNDSGAWIDLGRAQERGDPAQARTSYEKALALNSGNAAARLRLGILAGRGQRIGDALAHFSGAEKAYGQMSDYEGQAEVLLQRGRALIAANRANEGETDVRTALDRAPANGNVAQQVQALSQLSIASVLAGDRETARGHAVEAARLGASAGLESLAANVFVDLGNTFLAQYQLKEAEANFEEALEMAKRYKLPGREAMASLSLASLATRREQPDLALAFARPAVEYYRSAGYARNRALGQTVIVQALILKQQFNEASAVVETELADESSRADINQRAQWIETRADIESRRGMLPKTLAGYREARELRKQAGRKAAEVYAALNEADILSQLGRADEAGRVIAQWSETAAKLDTGVQSRWFAVSARAALRRGDRAGAGKMARAGLAVRGGKSALRIAEMKALACAAGSHADCAGLAVPGASSEVRIYLAVGAAGSGNRGTANRLLSEVAREARGVNPEIEYRALSLAGGDSNGPASELRRAWGEESFALYSRRVDFKNK